jgi:V/A-type H+-transporting ATPase subunit F
MQVFVIGDHSTCLAFSLGGIATRTVKGREKTAAALQFAVDNQKIGLVLITEKNAALVRPEMDKIIYTMHRPLVVEIPDTAGSLPGRPSAGELMMSLMKQ